MSKEIKKPSAYSLWMKAKEEGLDFEQLLKDNGAIVCIKCMGTGFVSIGGSFGGSTQTMRCDCNTNP